MTFVIRQLLVPQELKTSLVMRFSNGSTFFLSKFRSKENGKGITKIRKILKKTNATVNLKCGTGFLVFLVATPQFCHFFRTV